MGATSQASRGRLRGRLSAPWCGYSASHCASIAGFGTLAGSLHRPGQSGGEFWGRGIWELESGSARAVDSELDLGLGDLGGGNEAVARGSLLITNKTQKSDATSFLHASPLLQLNVVRTAGERGVAVGTRRSCVGFGNWYALEDGTDDQADRPEADAEQPKPPVEWDGAGKGA